MSVTTRKQLEALDPSHLGDLAKALRAQAQKYEAQRSQFPTRLRHPGGGEEWTGQASDALQAKAHGISKTYGMLDDKLTDCAAQCEQAQDHLSNAVKIAKQAVVNVESNPVGFELPNPQRHVSCGCPFQVQDDLTVKAVRMPNGLPMEAVQALNDKAAELTKDISIIVGQLNDVSDTWGAKIKASLDLTGLALDSKSQPYTAYDPKHNVHDIAKAIADGTEPVPTNPYILHHLWQQWNKDEKDAIYNRHNDIGNHAGIPFDPYDHIGRDHYNKMHMQDLSMAKQFELDKARDEHPNWDPNQSDLSPGSLDGMQWQQWSDRVKKLQHEMDGYNSVREALNNSSKDGLPRYLGIIDDQGLAAVSINNPDTAKDTVTLVPGTTVDTAQMEGYDRKSLDIHNSAMQAADDKLRPEDVSVTTWLGYDRPMSVPDPFNPKWAGDPSFALNGAKALDDWQDGLRASHDDSVTGGPSRNTVIGHSYGTSEVGAAATHGNRLDTDVVVLLASPGAFADSASGLNTTGSEVYVGKSNWDPINVANAGSAIGASDLGNDPADWKDAHQIDAGDGGHSSYFDPNNPAMKNIGRIVIGDDRDVTPKK
jgi:uncharacterized protein YukE